MIRSGDSDYQVDSDRQLRKNARDVNVRQFKGYRKKSPNELKIPENLLFGLQITSSVLLNSNGSLQRLDQRDH
jgi:hypothetical protein